ncbi:MAG: hypothetical protein ACE5ID_02335 [Acidobacteriota bacterium]
MLDDSEAETALDAMQAGDLRALIREIVPWLDHPTHARLINALVDRAARNSAGWMPKGPTEKLVADIVAFADAAKRVGQADPEDMDAHLRQGCHAFLARNYQAAFRIFRALLIPLSDVDIDLDQHEMLDEVLGVDVGRCAAQYIVSMYMTSSPQHRGKAVLSAVEDVQAVGSFRTPLREMERVAVEPFPGFDRFLSQWRALIEERTAGQRAHDWDYAEDLWLREVVHRMEGTEGLARIARATRRNSDLRAWCRALVEASDWKSALAAFDEAARLLESSDCSRGNFLDGAALAAQELARKDLPSRLERAWREAPDMARLRRWLGSSRNGKVLSQRVAEALLHVLDGDPTAAAKLLAAAPGLGWSDPDHPGPLLFPLFAWLLGDEASGEITIDTGEPGLFPHRDGPRLRTPRVSDLLKAARVAQPEDDGIRAAMIKAMRRAAEKRIAGVIENKRRKYYRHAASLVLACTRIDDSAGTAVWFMGLRDRYRRYPALQGELKRAGSR